MTVGVSLAITFMGSDINGLRREKLGYEITEFAISYYIDMNGILITRFIISHQITLHPTNSSDYGFFVHKSKGIMIYLTIDTSQPN